MTTERNQRQPTRRSEEDQRAASRSTPKDAMLDRKPREPSRIEPRRWRGDGVVGDEHTD